VPFIDADMQRVDFVYDGDTLRLNDGSKVRLAGVNTPNWITREAPTSLFPGRRVLCCSAW